MARLTASLLVFALGAAAAVALVSCGDSDAQLLPGETAREITANLDTVKQLAAEGDCVGAAGAAEQVSTQIEELGGVDRQLKQALRAGAERLGKVVATCVPATTSEETAEGNVPLTTETTTTTDTSKKEEKTGKTTTGATTTTPTTPTETTTPTIPPSSGGGTGAPGGVSPGRAVGEGK
ncbi:MAG: hypothetical protein FVQ78_05730 [Solirubrobacterales bacterium]|nr:hypothetical protein [Solirubrobacterales bacterium]